MLASSSNNPIIFSIATDEERQCIYKMRHRIYAEELKQHAVNSIKLLKDELDSFNIYIIAKDETGVVGFISITPSGSPRFSVDKYVARTSIPYPFDNLLFEIRLLTVEKERRSSFLALLLMFAAMRWIEVLGGKYVVAICRSDIMDMYRKAGLKSLGYTIESGEVRYELSIASIEDIKLYEEEKIDLFKSLKDRIKWELPFPYFTTPCYHGGAFFKAVGEDLQTLYKSKEIINADVLDAWFDPSPKVIDAMQKHLPWLLKTSPPTHADGLIDEISDVRKIDRRCILPGAGSSDLIYLGLQHFLSPTSKVLILDPCYGEYVHVLENVIGCNVTPFMLSIDNDFIVDRQALLNEVKQGYDMLIMVNPNSPTGRYVTRDEMELFLSACKDTIVWIDETYIDYTGSANSLELIASKSTNVIVCKSMSKVYALSGVRVAYLCSSITNMQALKTVTPPWAVSLPAQLAAINALHDPEYYLQKYEETALLRKDLIDGLVNMGFETIIEGVANFILFFLPVEVGTADEFIEKCKKQNLFLRAVKNMGTTLGDRAVRIAVKDKETNLRMLDIMRQVAKKNVEVIT